VLLAIQTACEKQDIAMCSEAELAVDVIASALVAVRQGRRA
jgi:hypothetical protein